MALRNCVLPQSISPQDIEYHLGVVRRALEDEGECIGGYAGTA